MGLIASDPAATQRAALIEKYKHIPAFYDLPDLSDWLGMEILTLNQAALMFGAIEPFDGVSVHNLESFDFLPIQKKKVNFFHQALLSGVCTGSLECEYIELAIEHLDGYNNPYVEAKIITPSEVDLGCLESINLHKTIIKQLVLINWMRKRGFTSLRALAQEKAKFELKEKTRADNKEADEEFDRQVKTTPVALLWFDKNSETYPRELDIANQVYTEASKTPIKRGTATKTHIENVIETKFKEEVKGSTAANRIATVVNWDKKGGAPKT